MKNLLYITTLCLVFNIFLAQIFAKETPKNQKDSKVTNLAYSIQVGSFKDIKNAGNLADFLSKKGFDAFFFKEGEMYKVRFGNYLNDALAKESAARLKAQNIIEDFFVVTPQSYIINQPKDSIESKNVAKNSAKEPKMSLRESIVKHAHSYIGVPYKWGGESSSGFDCSGLVRSVYKLNGLSLPRTSRDQYDAGDFVLKKDMKIGDLVFFAINGKTISHVGIYIGDGKFIHAPGRGKKVTTANLESNYWKRVYKGARSYF